MVEEFQVQARDARPVTARFVAPDKFCHCRVGIAQAA